MLDFEDFQNDQHTSIVFLSFIFPNDVQIVKYALNKTNTWTARQNTVNHNKELLLKWSEI